MVEIKNIADIIVILQSKEWYGLGEYTEFSKGSREIPRNWKDVKNKLIRVWRSKR